MNWRLRFTSHGSRTGELPRHLRNKEPFPHHHYINKKRRRGKDELAPPDGDEKGPADDRPRAPYWPVDSNALGGTRTMSWEDYPLKWEEFPHLPHVMTCTSRALYSLEVPQDALHVFSYTRADFWNLLPWVGRKLVWGQGLSSGIDVRQDHPPFYHECTLARDFITHWAGSAPDSAVVGRCAVMVPMVCAYCWGHTWRRCDSIPRVGCYIPTEEARLSPVLEECDHCGLTSDYNIVRFITGDDLDAVLALVSRGATSVHNVLRCVASSDVIAGFSIGETDAHVGALQSLLELVRIPFRAALDASVPMIANTAGIGSIILEYWQGVDMLSAYGFAEAGSPVSAVMDLKRKCTHSFPCASGLPDGDPNARCRWMDEWAQELVQETTMANPRLNDFIAEHAEKWFPEQVPDPLADRFAGRIHFEPTWGVQLTGSTWSPDSWAAWGVLRAHECEGQDGDEEEPDSPHSPVELGEFGM